VKDLLIIGYGNPGRADDGLGVAFAEEIEKLTYDYIEIESDYQLSVEHAYDISKSKLAILADAHTSCSEPFELRQVKPSPAFSFTTHSVSPENIVKFANDLSGGEKEVFILGIRGYEFNIFKETITERAQINLKKTLDCFKNVLKESNPAIIRNSLQKICLQG